MFDVRPYYAHGCFCLQVCPEDTLLVLDAQRLEFSPVDLPPPLGSCKWDMAIVEAAEARLGMLTISEHTEAGVYKYHLVYDVLHPKDENGANQWQSKSAIPLPVNYRYSILGVAGGYLLLIGYPQQNRLVLDYFSLNLQTFQIEWFCQTGRCAITSDLYADLPLSLAPPTI
ncbi:unnamed protein product [Triticum turgidum subsp. durum]|uniref:Uncharacterized protein n=1 Tax=Triticum turgidum subsp. durum TaxID=4567 RepID=A0A9R0Z1W8_TRITD|nr:unnamed protein product [Triticum turgidum subsp. durum]